MKHLAMHRKRGMLCVWAWSRDPIFLFASCEEANRGVAFVWSLVNRQYSFLYLRISGCAPPAEHISRLPLPFVEGRQLIPSLETEHLARLPGLLIIGLEGCIYDDFAHIIVNMSKSNFQFVLAKSKLFSTYRWLSFCAFCEKVTVLTRSILKVTITQMIPNPSSYDHSGAALAFISSH